MTISCICRGGVHGGWIPYHTIPYPNITQLNPINHPHSLYSYDPSIGIPIAYHVQGLNSVRNLTISFISTTCHDLLLISLTFGVTSLYTPLSLISLGFLWHAFLHQPDYSTLPLWHHTCSSYRCETNQITNKGEHNMSNQTAATLAILIGLIFVALLAACGTDEKQQPNLQAAPCATEDVQGESSYNGQLCIVIK